MNIFLFKKLATIIVLSVALLFIFIIYTTYSGEKITQLQAGSICAKMVNDYISPNFSITRVEYRDFFSSSNVKISLYITFDNGRKTSSDCIFQRRNHGEILLKQAMLVNASGNLRVLDNILISVVP